MRWYAKKLGGPANQAIIIDEETGRNVAVAYDAKDAETLAAAPEALEVLRRCWEFIDSGGYTPAPNSILRHKVYEVLTEAGIKF